MVAIAITDLQNVTDMTDISVEKYLLVAVKSLEEHKDLQNQAFFCTTDVRFLCLN